MFIIGHRGAAGLAKENTAESIKLAIKHHVNAVEVDIRVTKDNVAVLYHDKSIKNADKPLTIKHSTFDSIKKVEPDILTLDQLLQQFGNKILLIIEIKPGEDYSVVISSIKSQLNKGLKNDNLWLGSKSQRILRQLHRELPDVQLVVIESWSGIIAHHRAKQIGTKKLFMAAGVLYGWYIRGAIKRGYELYPYSVNSPDKAQSWQKANLTGIITDFPDRFDNTI